jgi:uncharacterized membrane protein (UPF0127 family)
MEPASVMPGSVGGYVLNCTRGQYLATRLAIADGHWSRMRGLMGRKRDSFSTGDGLWILPCKGVHTLGMRFPIDVVYLSSQKVVVHLEQALPPWRFAPVRLKASSVLELPENTLRTTGTTIGDKLEIATRTPGETPPA